MATFETRLLIGMGLDFFFNFIVHVLFPPVRDCLKSGGIGLSFQINLHLQVDRIGLDRMGLD